MTLIDLFLRLGSEVFKGRGRRGREKAAENVADAEKSRPTIRKRQKNTVIRKRKKFIPHHIFFHFLIPQLNYKLNTILIFYLKKKKCFKKMFSADLREEINNNEK